MFTGLVQGLGHLTFLNDYQVQIHSLGGQSLDFLGSLALGDSVAVDGVCLTVESFLGAASHGRNPQGQGWSGFIAATSPETLRRTTLGQSSPGHGPRLVNLEPSLRVGDKLGGHFVTGHIDGIGSLMSAEPTATSWVLRFQVESPGIARYLVPKGSIAVNGISLTVAQCEPRGESFEVAVIPHTFAATNLQHLRSGDGVNLEGDILGKYVERLLQFPSEKGPHGSPPDLDISPAFLAEHGYG